MSINPMFAKKSLEKPYQEVYDKVLDAVMEMDSLITIDVSEWDEFENKWTAMFDEDFAQTKSNIINCAIQADHPEVFWVNFSRILTVPVPLTKGKYIVKLSYYMSKTERDNNLKLLEERADAIIAQFKDESDYDFAIFLMEWLAKNVTKKDVLSNEEIKNMSSGIFTILPYEFSKRNSVWGALIEGSSLCFGYASAYTYVMNRRGIPCATVVGNNSSDPLAAGHAWNMAKLDEEWCHIDCIFSDYDDSTEKINTVETDYSYFGLTDRENRVTHNFDLPFSGAMPKCVSTQNNYFRRKDLMFDKADVRNIANHMVDILRDFELGYQRIGYKSVQFAFSSKAESEFFAEHISLSRIQDEIDKIVLECFGTLEWIPRFKLKSAVHNKTCFTHTLRFYSNNLYNPNWKKNVENKKQKIETSESEQSFERKSEPCGTETLHKPTPKPENHKIDVQPVAKKKDEDLKIETQQNYEQKVENHRPDTQSKSENKKTEQQVLGASRIRIPDESEVDFKVAALVEVPSNHHIILEDDNIVAGAGQGCQLFIFGSNVDKCFEIYRDNGVWMIRNLSGKPNVVFVNGKDLTKPVELQSNMFIKIADAYKHYKFTDDIENWIVEHQGSVGAKNPSGSIQEIPANKKNYAYLYEIPGQKEHLVKPTGSTIVRTVDSSIRILSASVEGVAEIYYDESTLAWKINNLCEEKPIIYLNDVLVSNEETISEFDLIRIGKNGRLFRFVLDARYYRTRNSDED